MPTWVSPRRDDLDIGLEAIERKLKTDLVVTLASATMGNVANHR